MRRHFLTPRLLRDWLVLFNQLAGNDTAGAEVATVAQPPRASVRVGCAAMAVAGS